MNPRERELSDVKRQVLAGALLLLVLYAAGACVSAPVPVDHAPRPVELGAVVSYTFSGGDAPEFPARAIEAFRLSGGYDAPVVAGAVPDSTGPLEVEPAFELEDQDGTLRDLLALGDWSPERVAVVRESGDRSVPPLVLAATREGLGVYRGGRLCATSMEDTRKVLLVWRQASGHLHLVVQSRAGCQHVVIPAGLGRSSMSAGASASVAMVTAMPIPVGGRLLAATQVKGRTDSLALLVQPDPATDGSSDGRQLLYGTLSLRALEPSRELSDDDPTWRPLPDIPDGVSSADLHDCTFASVAAGDASRHAVAVGFPMFRQGEGHVVVWEFEPAPSLRAERHVLEWGGRAGLFDAPAAQFGRALLFVQSRTPEVPTRLIISSPYPRDVCSLTSATLPGATQEWTREYTAGGSGEGVVGLSLHEDPGDASAFIASRTPTGVRFHDEPRMAGSLRPGKSFQLADGADVD